MKKILITLLIGSPFLVFAQEESTDPCVQNIEIAQQRYDEGRIQDIQPLLLDCLEQGRYDKAQKSQVLRLLTLSYIFLEEDDKAEATMLELLHTNHEFQVNATIDPTEFINLHERFRYKPLFSVGGRYIFNLSQPIISGINSAASLTNARPEYDLGVGLFGFGINFEWEFADNFVLYPELQYKTMNVAKTDYVIGVVNQNNEPYITIKNVTNMQWLSIPISVKYYFNFSNTRDLRLYANLGGSMDYLLSYNRSPDKNVAEFLEAPAIGESINGADDQNRLNFGVFAGGGITYKLGEGFVSLEARYQYSFTDVTQDPYVINPGNPKQLTTLVQDDIYKLNHIAISLGYTLNIYIPKQLR